MIFKKSNGLQPMKDFKSLSFEEKLQVYRRLGCTVPPRKIIKNAEQIQGIKKHGTSIPPLGKVAERSEIG